EPLREHRARQDIPVHEGLLLEKAERREAHALVQVGGKGGHGRGFVGRWRSDRLPLRNLVVVRRPERACGWGAGAASGGARGAHLTHRSTAAAVSRKTSPSSLSVARPRRPATHRSGSARRPCSASSLRGGISSSGTGSSSMLPSARQRRSVAWLGKGSRPCTGGSRGGP